MNKRDTDKIKKIGPNVERLWIERKRMCDCFLIGSSGSLNKSAIF